MEWEIIKVKHNHYENRAIIGDGHTMFLNDVLTALKRKEYLESKFKWKTPEVDGIPEKGVYLLKLDAEECGWVYRTAEIVAGGFRLCHNSLPIKPNYYRLIEEGN